jgi:hypothetical protein
MTSKMGNSFVQDDTSSAVLTAAGEARPGPTVRFKSWEEVGLAGDVGRLAPFWTSSLFGLPDKGSGGGGGGGGGGDAIGSSGVTGGRNRRTRSLTVACWASVEIVFKVRKKRYWRPMGAAWSGLVGMPSLDAA